ncbi:MAG: 16S rRNA (cytidine(1402)-2'-O)-methyltransferase [Syntrophobacteraceae bacterium]
MPLKPGPEKSQSKKRQAGKPAPRHKDQGEQARVGRQAGKPAPRHEDQGEQAGVGRQAGKPAPRDDNPAEREGQLFIVATPIGNLADITLRALETLRSVDLIAAEDTRHTRKLLSRYDIHKPLISYHENNARQRGAEILEKIASGQSVAVVTDAGTPGISDPGMLLISEALPRGVEPVPIPGPTALVSALVVSGLPAHPFAFLGFPPPRGTVRRRFFVEYAAVAMTLILYESPKRLAKTLKDIHETWGDRRVAVARELTKIHEEVFRGTVSEALAHFEGEVRGELTLVVEGFGAEAAPGSGSEGWEAELERLIGKGVSSKGAALDIAVKFSIPRRTVYQAAVKMRGR